MYINLDELVVSDFIFRCWGCPRWELQLHVWYILPFDEASERRRRRRFYWESSDPIIWNGSRSEGVEVQREEKEPEIRENHQIRLQKSLRRDASKNQRPFRKANRDGIGDGWSHLQFRLRRCFHGGRRIRCRSVLLIFFFFFLSPEIIWCALKAFGVLCLI